MSKVELTPREYHIVRLTCEECLSVPDIARKLKISQDTVHSHKYRVYDKLDIVNVMELCRWWYEEEAK